MSEEKAKKILPLGLLVEGRSCLVVGGGTVAGRKAEALVEAGAKVTIVAPKPGERVMALQSVHGVKIIRRSYAPDDLDQDFFLVFAATDDHALNQQIIETCRARRILCACPDRGWQNGDFISPASFRKGDVTISVSTGGASCRRSRLIKDTLARHVDMIDAADLLVIGTDHNHLSLNKLELYSLVGEKLRRTGRRIMHVWDVHEFLLLNTCNRIELIAIAADDADSRDVLIKLLGFENLGRDELNIKRGMEAFIHTAQVAAGLLSQTPGEEHVSGQLRKSLRQACASGWAAAIMQDWIGNTIHISREIRRQAEPFLKTSGIEDVGARFVREEFTDLSQRHVMVIGSGVTGSGVVGRLAPYCTRMTWLYHTRPPDLAGLPTEKINVCPINALPMLLGKIDVVICATNSDKYVLHGEHASLLKPHGKFLLLDLSVPRNIEPELANIVHGVKIVDIEDLKRWRQPQIPPLDRVFEISRRIILEHQDLYEKMFPHHNF
ncbi:MAG: NAD(P)-dependent oxidoreductase [Kiritimatiellia bacterium]|nr:NAD(P)-dependent oxidoreductase [Kiritimatiellia bacterium]